MKVHVCKAGYQVSSARFRVSQELSSAWFPCRLEMAGLAREPAQKKRVGMQGAISRGWGGLRRPRTMRGAECRGLRVRQLAGK